MSEIAERSPQLIAAEIRSIDTQTREIVLRSAIEIGKRLKEAKGLVSHGEWGTWLGSNVSYSQSTANNFMKIAEEYASNSQAIENLSYTKAIALLGVPADEREQFIQENDVENTSARELQKIIKEKQQLEKKLKTSEKEREKFQKELSNHQMKVSQLTVELAEAKIAGNGEEAAELQQQLEKSKTELIDSQKKIKELEKQLKAKPIEVDATEVIERIPEEVERELTELRQKVQSDQGTLKFKIQFEAVVSSFKQLLGTLEEITDPTERDKYKGAVSALISKMSERL